MEQTRDAVSLASIWQSQAIYQPFYRVYACEFIKVLRNLMKQLFRSLNPYQEVPDLARYKCEIRLACHLESFFSWGDFLITLARIPAMPLGSVPVGFMIK